MLIFLYGSWNSDEVRSYLGIDKRECRNDSLEGYEIGYTADGYATIYEKSGAVTEGSLTDIDDNVMDALDAWAHNNNYDFKQFSFGIEQALVLTAENSVKDGAISLSGSELRGVLQLDCPLNKEDKPETGDTQSNEVDLFSKYTYKDKEWWSKYKIAMCALAGAFSVAVVVFGVILGQWFLSSKHTDNLGIHIREEVTATTPVTSVPTEMIGFNGEPIEIIFPEEIQPADQVYDVLEIDFDELRKKYPNAVAWLVVPGVGIEYPVAQYEDNDYYLTHGIDGTLSRAGWVFSDYRNTTDTPLRNFIIYGHNMKDGTIFGKLPRVLDESWWSDPDNQYIYLVTEYYTAVYQVFNTMRVKSEEIYYYRRDLSDRNVVEFMEEMIGYNLLSEQLLYSKPFRGSDRLITLSTCADAQGVEKFVVQGVLVYSKRLKDNT